MAKRANVACPGTRRRWASSRASPASTARPAASGWSVDLASKHRQLVAQHDDLGTRSVPLRPMSRIS